jgi:hypothetical protein
MATFENTVMIGRSIEVVFAFLCDLENVPKWNYAIDETRTVSEGPTGVGTTFMSAMLGLRAVVPSSGRPAAQRRIHGSP